MYMQCSVHHSVHVSSRLRWGLNSVTYQYMYVLQLTDHNTTLVPTVSCTYFPVYNLDPLVASFIIFIGLSEVMLWNFSCGFVYTTISPT